MGRQGRDKEEGRGKKPCCWLFELEHLQHLNACTHYYLLHVVPLSNAPGKSPLNGGDRQTPRVL